MRARVQSACLEIGGGPNCVVWSDADGFTDKEEKTNADSIPGFWGYKEFDFGRLGTLPVPPKPFALHFGGSRLKDSQLHQLQRFREADAIALNGTRITDSGLTHVLAFRDVKILDLGHTAVGDEGIQTLAKLSKLKTLILWSTEVSDVGADTLSQMTTLEFLDTCDTAITDEGLKKIASLPSLRYLGVSNTQATSSGIAAVKKQHPDIEIVEQLANIRGIRSQIWRLSHLCCHTPTVASNGPAASVDETGWS